VLRERERERERDLEIMRNTVLETKFFLTNLIALRIAACLYTKTMIRLFQRRISVDAIKELHLTQFR